MGDRTNAREHTEGPAVVALSTRPGSGQLCDACQQPIESTQVEFRRRDKADPDSVSSCFHQWCYYAKFASDR